MEFETIIHAAYASMNEWMAILGATPETERGKKQHEMLDSFRNTLEPYIYQYLTWKYGRALDTFWKTYMPPKKARLAYVIVERRIHHNFWFMLRNIAWANPNASVYIFCSDLNRPYIESLLGEKKEAFHVIEWFKGNVSRDQGKQEYCKAFMNRRLYETVDAEYILTFQMDCIFRKKFSDELCIGSYWGAPWGWNPSAPGGGGITVRNVAMLRELCPQENTDAETWMEDCWIGEQVQNRGLPVPPFEVRRELIMENTPARDPIAVHQFWTFLLNYNPQNPPQFAELFARILTLEGLQRDSI